MTFQTKVEVIESKNARSRRRETRPSMPPHLQDCCTVTMIICIKSDIGLVFQLRAYPILKIIYITQNGHNLSRFLFSLLFLRKSINFDYNLSPFLECSRYLHSQLICYICKTKKLERAVKTKDVLCSSLADKLDVMKEDKKFRVTSTDMSKNRMNENDYKVGGDSGEYNRCNGTNEPDRIRDASSDNASNEEQIFKAKFESTEKELKKVKEDLNKTTTEKSKVSFLEKLGRRIRQVLTNFA